jgi:hypothetical protein
MTRVYPGRALSQGSIVCDGSEEHRDVELERFARAIRRPREMIVDECWPLLVRSPDLERCSIAIDNPVFRNTALLKRAPFRDAIMARRSGRQNLAHEKRCHDGPFAAQPLSLDPGNGKEVRFKALSRLELEFRRAQQHLAESLTGEISL